MQITSASNDQKLRQPPWNKGKLFGAKPPLPTKHVWSIRTKLQVDGRLRDLAMFNLAIGGTPPPPLPTREGSDPARIRWRG
jgi:hypothetical protein